MTELALRNSRLDKRYEILELLGRGSYAEIWSARDDLAFPGSPHSMVAVKALNVFMQNDLDAELERTLIDNFQNEAAALDRVRHPNIVSRLGHGTARDLGGVIFHYLILEYLPGGDLARLVRKGPLAPERLLELAGQVCTALAHAHARGVIHRDIKPQNLLLTADLRTVKIADFGVARFSDASTPVTRVGTNIYAPPEHSPLALETGSSDAHGELTPAADIYSLAKSVYVLLTGESPRPFAGNPISSLPPSAAGEWWAPRVLPVLSRATRGEPSMRHRSVDEFWADLRSALSAEAEEETAVAARPAPAAESQETQPAPPQRPTFMSSAQMRGVRAETVKSSAATAGPRRLWPAMTQKPKPQPELPKSTPAAAMRHESRPTASRRKSRKKATRAAAVVLGLAAFLGVLYGTNVVIRSGGVLSGLFIFSKTAVATQDVNVRKEPRADSARVGSVARGARVRIVNSSDNWYEIEADGLKGWINGKFLQLD